MTKVKNGYGCFLPLVAALVGGKWKKMILWKLRGRTVRFAELIRMLEPITQKVLTQQLRDLEQDGLIVRQAYAVVPPRVEYSLTPQGERLIPVLEHLWEWSTRYAKDNAIQLDGPVDSSCSQAGRAR